MRSSENHWRRGWIAAFLAGAALIYAGLYVWSDRLVRTYGDRNPFYRIETAPQRVDWLVLGASHAMPLGFADMPAQIEDETGERLLVLGVTGGGPFVQRLVAERYFADHSAGDVLVIVDAFAFADPRWNAERMGDSDMMPKIPADPTTLAVMARAVPRGLDWRAVLDYATGFSRISDQQRFSRDVWEAEEKFDSAPRRPSDAADAARIEYLYPGPPSERAMDQGFRDLAAIIALAREHGAGVVLIRPPIPDRFRERLPEIQGFEPRLSALAERTGTRLVDHSALIPEPKYYLDSDHLNRSGVGLWIDRGLGPLLRGGG